MSTPVVEFAPLTKEAVIAVTGSEPVFRMAGKAVLLDGELVGIVGEYIQPDGWRVIFSEQIRPDVLPRKYRVRLIRDIMRDIEERGVPVMALCASSRDRAFLEKFGFRFNRETDSGALMVWGV